MLLKTRENVLLLISSSHEIFKKKDGNARFLKNMLLESVKMVPMRPQTFRRLIYFACNLVVSSNASQWNLLDFNCTIGEIKQLCTKQYGGVVQFKMNNYSHLFKFSDIIEQSQTLLFYSNSLIQRFNIWKKRCVMSNIYRDSVGSLLEWWMNT